jgi:hypothetical protein
MLLEDGVK